MAFTHVANRGTGASGVSGSTLGFSPAATLAVGTLQILVVAADNINNVDADNNEHLRVTDNAAGSLNQWRKLGEFTNGGGGAAAGGTVSLWACRIVTAVATTDTITVIFASAIVDKTCTLHEFTTAAGKIVNLAQRANNETNGTTGFGSVSTSGLASKEYLHVRALMKEANSTTNITSTTNYTAMTGQRSRNNTAAVLVRGEFRINTTTSETSNPTLAVTGDTVGVFAALEEIDPPLEDNIEPIGSTFLRDVAAVAMAVSLATGAASAHATAHHAAWQDEMGPAPMVGATTGIAPPMWTMADSRPRFVSGGADEMLGFAATPVPLDDYTWVVPYVAPAALAIDAPPADEVIVPQPAATIVDDLGVAPHVVAASQAQWLDLGDADAVASAATPTIVDELDEPPPSFVVRSRVHATDDVDEAIAQAPPPATTGATSGVAPPLWAMASSTPRLLVLSADDGIVPPPQPLGAEDDPWTLPFTVPPVTGPTVAEWQDEIVAQPTPAPADDGAWASPFAVPLVVSLDVAEQQDERVAQPTSVPLDDGTAPQFAAPADVWIPVPWQYAYGDGIAWSPIDEQFGPRPHIVPATIAVPHAFDDDAVVIQPVPVRHEEYLVEPYTAPQAVHVSTSFDEVIVPQPVPVRHEEYATELYRAPAPVHELRTVEETIVPQLVPFPADDGAWTPPFSVPAVHALEVAEHQDELKSLTSDEETWSAPFTVPAVCALDVSHAQDERVTPPAPLGFDEGTWTAPFTSAPVRSLEISGWQDERVEPRLEPWLVDIELSIRPAVDVALSIAPHVDASLSLAAHVAVELRLNEQDE